MEGATHFIEQYNNTPDYAITNGNKEYFTPVLPISELQHCLDNTEMVIALHTVAIFKIKFKDPCLTKQ